MNKTLVFINLILILGLLLSACGASVSGGIQLPSLSGGSDDSGGQAAQNNTLIYILIGAAVLVVVVVALLKK